ncbi:hypothetical protein QTV49_000587 [Vibrio vulnificus]|nr:hypothetical protein [Vibrio vulnificus]
MEQAAKLTEEQRKQAISWLANDNYDISTVAQHFGLNREELAKEIRTV